MGQRTGWTLIVFMLGGLLGCAGQAHDPVQAPAINVPDADGVTMATDAGDQVQTALLMDLHIDPLGLTASLSPFRGATAAGSPQALSYDADIARFLSPNTLQVAAVSFNDFNDVVVKFRLNHPFDAPDFSAGTTAQNRADLSYTGRLFIVAESDSQDLPGGLKVDPWLVREPDGYAPVGDLLHEGVTGLTNTIFPYHLVVDEARDNREGITNGGEAIGNYDPATGGWQRANAGLDRKRWTGYDYLHGGQSALIEVTLRRASLQASDWTTRMAVVVQYTDPRGAAGNVDRFPAEPLDVTKFAYRLPYAALDCSRLTGFWDFQLSPEDGAYIPVSLALRDWDTGAADSGDPQLDDEPDVSKVQPGASAAPVVTVDFPALLPAPATLIKGAGTGLADAEIRYTAQIQNINNAAEGFHWGVAIATDPEDADAARGSYHFGADPLSMAPSAARRLPARTYLPIRIHVPPPTAGWIRTWGDVAYDTANEAVMDSQGNIYVASMLQTKENDVHPGDGRVRYPIGLGNFALTKLDRYGNRLSTWASGGTLWDTITSLQVDSEDGLFVRFRVSSQWLDLDPGPGEYRVGVGSLSNQVEAVVRYDADGEFQWGGSWDDPPSGTIFLVSSAPSANDELYFAGFWEGTADLDPTDGEDLRFGYGGADAFLIKLTANGQYSWIRTWGSSSPYGDTMYGLATLPGGGVAVGGALVPPFGVLVDLDPTNTDDYHSVSAKGSPVLVTLSSSGDYVWGRSWLTDSEGNGWIKDLAVSPVGQLSALGLFTGVGDFDPGPGSFVFGSLGTDDSLFLTNFDAGGNFLWAYGYLGLEGLPEHLWIGPGNAIYHTGFFYGNTDFDPGAGFAPASGSQEFGSQYLTSLTAGGAYRFVKRWDGELTGPYLPGIKPTPNGRLLLTGAAHASDDLILGPGTLPMISLGQADALVMNLTADADWN